jgi:hypothetical protein
MRYTTRPTVLALVLVATVFGLAACDETESKDPKASNLPPANVDLPAIPSDLGENAIPERHPDGALTVDGIKRSRLSWLDKEVTVKGKIAWVYKCPYEKDDKKKRPKKRKPDEEAAEDDGPRCQRAHFYIVDTAGDADVRLLIVGLSPELEESFEKGDIKLGDEHTMTGTFLEIGNGFVASDEGLVVLGTIKGFEPPPEEEGKR